MPEDGSVTKKYQLCRMVLINVGTNVQVPSGRITAIDPRGGAAVFGANGVGKTTTLRMLPLFFGHLPSQIIAAGQGQQAMIRFVLPTDASAIAFEYQRGSGSTEDLRLAVIRRRADDPDTPFYRLYRSGFRKDLFVADGRFLNDGETQAKAFELGIQATEKLTTPEYRAVILRTQAASKRRDRLRQYAVEWSFGPRQLDNLDRVVAAMVKKHINFADIVQVAVGLVQHNLGQGAERARINFKQGRAPIDHWLRNREACANAFALAPSFSALENDLADHRAAEARFRLCRADLALVTAARRTEAEELKAIVTAKAKQREDEKIRESQKREALSDAASSAAEAHEKVTAALSNEEAKARYFETEKAADWERATRELPGLKAQARAIDEQIGVAEAAQRDATLEYERLKSAAKDEISSLCLQLARDKTVPQQRHDANLQRIAALEVDARDGCDDEFAARQRQVDDQMERLQEERGIWDARKRHPVASETTIRILEEAEQKRNDHADSLNQVQALAGQMEIDLQAATYAFQIKEGELLKARELLAQANDALVAARARHEPAAGTFLAALRSHASDGWKRDLARVINPALLDREDLDPAHSDDPDATIYGWQLNTGVIETPDWSDDALSRQAVEEAEVKVDSVRQLVAERDAERTRYGKMRNEADKKVETADARLRLLKEQIADIKQQCSIAAASVEKEKREAVTQAETELSRVQGLIGDVKSQRQRLAIEKRDALATIKADHDRQRVDAEVVYRQAIEHIDGEIARLQEDLGVKLAGYDAQLNEHLSNAGVDIKRLATLRADVGKLRTVIRERESRVPLMEAWKEWLDSGGPMRLEALKATTGKTAKTSSEAAGALAVFQQALTESAETYDRHMKKLSERQREVEDDLDILVSLDDEFGDYQAVGASVIDRMTPAASFRRRVREERADLDKRVEGIRRRTTALRQALTAKPSSVQELVDASLDQEPANDEIKRASVLSICYKQIGPQVATDVNLTLKTLLINIGAFHKSIKGFEREVAQFNSRLQEGLSEVRCFERLKDLRLDIVTNFEGLGFYRKLSAMEDVVRRHAGEVGQDYTTILPPDETARALGDFMSVLGPDGNVEVNLSSHITVKGSISDNGQHKEFKRATELENISSEGLTSLVLITLMTALLNTIRGTDPVHVPWVTDEVGKFDPSNFRALMQKLRDNRIDVLTASPELGPTQQSMFARRYLFKDQGRIQEYDARGAAKNVSVPSHALEIAP